MFTGCTGRIQQRLQSARGSARKACTHLTDIARAVIHSRAVNDFCTGLWRIPQVGKIVYQSLFDKKQKTRESFAITRPIIKTNFLYYLIPVSGLMLTQYLVSSLEGSNVATVVNYMSLATLSFYIMPRRLYDNSLYSASFVSGVMLTQYLANSLSNKVVINLLDEAACYGNEPGLLEKFVPLGNVATTVNYMSLAILSFYIMPRRVYDNSLYSASLMRAHSDEIVRKRAQTALKNILKQLLPILSKAFAAKSKRQEFMLLLANNINDIFNKYFNDQKLFRNRHIEFLLTEDFYNFFASLLLRPESAVSADYRVVRDFSSALAKTLLARLIPEFAEPKNKFDEEIFNALKPIGLQDSAQDILNSIRFYTRKEDLTILPAEKCPHDDTGGLMSSCRNPLDYLAMMVFIFLVGRYAPGGPVLEFILNSIFYGRGLLEIKLGGFCQLDRVQTHSSKKAYTFAAGLPFAAVTYAVGPFFLRDVILNMALPLWTFAELEDTRPVQSEKQYLDPFWMPRKTVDIVLWVAECVAPLFRKKVNDPTRHRNCAQGVVEVVSSPKFNWGVACVLGDRSKLPKVELAPNFTQKLIAHGGLSFEMIQTSATPNALDVLLHQVESTDLFLKMYGRDIESGISMARKVRVFRPWLAGPLLTLAVPGMIASLVALLLHLLKEEGLNEVFAKVQAQLDRLRFDPELKPGEQKAKLKKPVVFSDRFARDAVVEANSLAAVQAPQPEQQGNAGEMKLPAAGQAPQPEPQRPVGEMKSPVTVQAQAQTMVATMLAPLPAVNEEKKRDSAAGSVLPAASQIVNRKSAAKPPAPDPDEDDLVLVDVPGRSDDLEFVDTPTRYSGFSRATARMEANRYASMFTDLTTQLTKDVTDLAFDAGAALSKKLQ